MQNDCPKFPGLSAEEASRLLASYGPNSLQEHKKINIFRKIFSYFTDPMIVILLIAATISGATGQFRGATIIISMVLLSVVLNFYQEHKSDKAAEKIYSRLAIIVKVRRGGKELEIDSKLIVPGDLVILMAGDIIPADGIILVSDDLFINESALTGESLPVEKDSIENKKAFAGTYIVSGFGELLVEATGQKTEFGKIAASLEKETQPDAFSEGVKKFGILLMKVIISIVSIIFLINLIMHKNFFDSLVFAIAVAVGVTPELLPMIMSVNMSKGAMRMMKKGVLVKKLTSIPDFGSMDVLCTDKTGTLTQDKITLVHNYNILGGESMRIVNSSIINASLESGIKSVLDQAIIQFNHDKAEKQVDLHKIAEIPYDFQRKRSSVVASLTGVTKIVTKGAPEEIFKICNFYDSEGNDEKFGLESLKKVKELYDKLSAEGFRVLALAEKLVENTGEKTDWRKEEQGLTLLGLMAFYDPPKEGVKEVLDFMFAHGIKIKILTGDSLLVTKKICNDIGFKINGAISGEDLDFNSMNDDEIYFHIKDAEICARLAPAQKEKIISLLRQNGLVVAYLGDGINDAPSLKMADVGISVENAVDIAREAADIILLKKGLQELMDGVLEGRRTFGNTMKYLLMGLSSNFGNMLSMIVASIFLPFFPMTAGQILLNNFIYDTSQLAIPTDNVDPEYLKKPRHWNMGLLKKFMLVFGPISSIFDVLTFFVLYKIFSLSGPAFQAGWFVESLATQVFVIHIIRTRKIPFFQSRASWQMTALTSFAVLVGAALTFRPLAALVGFEPLPWLVFPIIILIVLVYLVMMEVVKRIFYHFVKD
ncbi:MAG: magnesium-translocating P-type ATPase [Patescibacteria group bacterium]